MSFHRLKSKNARSGFGAIVLAVTLAAPTAQAADYLRGAYGGHQGVEPIGAPKSAGIDWAGVYFGGHAGISSGQADARSFAPGLAESALPNSNITDLLEDTIHFRETNKMRSSFGVFAGVNYLWDDVVLGIEADYTRANLNATSSSGPFALFRTIGTEEWGLNSTASARAKVTDWATLRGRVGWAAGYFMPYLTAGVAFGNIDGRANVSGTWTRTDVSNPPTRTQISSDDFGAVVGRSGITYGGVIGAGVDFALFSNVFLRAEWQYVLFASGNNRPDISINTARVAGGVKF